MAESVVPFLTIYWPLVLGVLFLLGIAYERWRRRVRARRTREAAADHGWRWEREDPALPHRWEFEDFELATEQYAQNVIRGERAGWSFVAYELRHVTRRGGWKKVDDSSFPVYEVALPRPLPKLEAGPEGLLGGRVARTFGFGDLQTGDEDLDTSWKIETEDEEFARALFHGRMRQVLQEGKALHWGIHGPAMVSWETGNLVLDEVPSRVDRMIAVIEQIPDEVWRVYGVDSDTGRDSHAETERDR